MNKKTPLNMTFGKPRRSNLNDRPGLFISSWSALDEYLKTRPSALVKVYCAASEAQKLRDKLILYGLGDLTCTEDDLLTAGFKAEVKLQALNEEDFLHDAATRVEDIIIACDHVTDTRNLGALARTAAFFGLSTILLPKDRQAPITSATLGTAQGAFAHINPVEVTNLGRTLAALKERGYWIAGADMAGNNVESLSKHYEKLVLVLGSEDRGISKQILAKCDFVLSVPAMGGTLESLNVSVAAGILIHALKAKSERLKLV